MGAEDFQVGLYLKKHVAANEALKMLLKQDFEFIDTDNNSSYLLLDVEDFFVEAEISDFKGTVISLRYAVCQPGDALLETIKTVWSLRASVEKSVFPDCNKDRQLEGLDTHLDLYNWVKECAQKKRELWFADFPETQRKTQCVYAYDGLIE
ncbi:hypothetical protein [Rubinisphaera italica]|uniref:Uncharacterized protein n=1 Tax=Rubinisphaera italica TaxID=2527969 RepID=A0A5C5XPE1_9PLAN|nr:hypothetical protein [Rubinisphaera italica]TWT64321.1 hypothetical protein Pan54_50830 [Rubinisphaera italica]